MERTRPRARTLTGAAHSPSNSDLPYLSATPVSPTFPHGISSASDESPAPIQPAPHTLDLPDARGSDTASTQDATTTNPDATFVEPIPAFKPAKPKVAPLDTSYRPLPSAFSRDPALTPVMNVRDSVSTQQSGTSSSLYPLSTSTASGLTSPTSPQSMADELTEDSVYVPEVTEVQDYDSDDVAYRLRLLVNNNYFLPPAHAKPSPAFFAPPPPLNPPKKGTTPAFLDLFRVGKSKSKPPTPPGGPGALNSFDPNLPMLRTAADSIASPYTLRNHHHHHPQQTRTSAQIPRLSPQIPNSATPRGRVVVVREKVTDIAVAAKQAEQDLKSKAAAAAIRSDLAGAGVGPGAAVGGGPGGGGSQKAKQDLSFDDVIDPTDAVDIPLPSPNYPFAVQASALNGLGVLDSLGADVLAEHLPPAKNPNLSYTYDPIEDHWRKALLHEAVHHSLDNTPDVSMFDQSSRILSGLETPGGAGSSRIQSPEGFSSRGETPAVTGPAANIGQKIIPHHPHHQRQKSNQSQKSTSTTRSKGNGHGGSRGATATNNNGTVPVAPSNHPAVHPTNLIHSNPNSSSHQNGLTAGAAGVLATSTKPPTASNGSSSLLNTSLDVSRPSSYLPQRVDTPSGPMTPLGPPPRRPGQGPVSPVVGQWSYSQGNLGSHPYAMAAEDYTMTSGSGSVHRLSHGSGLSSTYPRLRRAVSSPSLAEGYESHASGSVANHHHHLQHYPLPQHLPSYHHHHASMGLQRDSRATTMSFDTARGSSASLTDGSSIHQMDMDVLDPLMRASFVAVGGARPSTAIGVVDPTGAGVVGSGAGPTSGSTSSVNAPPGAGPLNPLATQSRPSLSVSEYSQSSMASPTSSAFQEMLNRSEAGDHGSGSVSTHAGPSRFSLEQRQRHHPHSHPQTQPSPASSGSAPRVPSVASRYTAMSPPPRMSSSLAHVALPPPPRSSSLQYRLAGKQQQRSGFVDEEQAGVPPRSSSSDSGHYTPGRFQTADEDLDVDDDEEDDDDEAEGKGRHVFSHRHGHSHVFLQERPATSGSAHSAPVPATKRGHLALTPRPRTGPSGAPSSSAISMTSASKAFSPLAASTSSSGSTSTAADGPLPSSASSSRGRGLAPTTPLTLSIPTVSIPLEIHSAPGPSSPTSFFDSIQAQPNAMDDLDSSSDEDDEDEDNTTTTTNTVPLPPLPPPPVMNRGVGGVGMGVGVFSTPSTKPPPLASSSKSSNPFGLAFTRARAISSVSIRSSPSSGGGSGGISFSSSSMGAPPPVGVKSFGMKLGNFSTPYLRAAEGSKQSLVLLHPPVGHQHNPRSPVLNSPSGMGSTTSLVGGGRVSPAGSGSASVSSCVSGGSHGGVGPAPPVQMDPTSPFDVYRHNQQQQQQHQPVFTPPPVVPVSPSVGGSSEAGSRRPSTAEESMRRLDGMLLRHMEDEKDTIKRIAAAAGAGTSTPLRHHT